MKLNPDLIRTRCQEIEESRAGIIDHELSRRLQQTARFRNMLVHMYWKVDYGTVYDIIADSLDDLANFSRSVARYVTDS